MFLMLLQEGVAVTTAPVLRGSVVGTTVLAARTQGQPDGVLSCASDRFCAKSPDHGVVTSRMAGWAVAVFALSLPADADNAKQNN